jgi:octaprenyl-diphosphate synthase
VDFQHIILPVQKEIDEFEGLMFGLLSSEVPFVQSVAEHVLKTGGKRLRPILTIVAARLSGFKGTEAHKLGACIEFIHTASLLHDDVIDNARIRRGRESANVKWGNHVSVLVGDFLYCRGSQLLTAQGDLRILKVVTDAITATTEGEVLEITKNLDLSTTTEDYLNIIRAKTAVLMAAACQIGAILGNISEEFETALKLYGAHLGMAFQLADDVLDYTSSEEVFGKANGIDLQEGKLTLPLIIALKQADDGEIQTIKKAVMGDKLEKDTFVKIHGIIKKYRGFESTYDLARSYIGRAKESLSPFRSSIEKDILLLIADYVIARDR